MALELPKFGKKDKAEKAAGPKNDVMLKVMDFFDKNPIMKIVIPVVLFLILAGVIIYLVIGDGVILGDGTTGTTDPALNSNQVQVLPGNEPVTDKEIVELINSDPLSEDILLTAEYKGYTKGSTGLKVALIQIGSSGQSIELSKGETIGDSKWELIEITSDYVVFQAGEKTKKINKG